MNDNALTRVVREGAREADRRVARWLSPAPSTETDRYLASSWVVRRVDAACRTLWSWWLHSRSASLLSAGATAWSTAERAVRVRAAGLTLVIAVIAHVAMMMAQGPRDGWVWLVLPATAGAIGVMLLVAAGTNHARG
jgi:hypothetical protein